MFRTIPRVNLPFCPGVSFSLNGWWGCFFFDVLPVFFPPFVVLAAPFWVLPFASRIIVIASFVLLLLLNQIQISNPLGNKKNAHESNSLLLQKRRKMLSHSRTPNETDLSLSLSLSFEIVYSFVSFLVVARNTFPPTREKRVERLKIIFMTMFFVHFTKQAFRSKFASFIKKKNKREQKEGGRDEGCDEDDDVRGDEAESDADESADFEDDDDDDTDDSKIFFLF